MRCTDRPACDVRLPSVFPDESCPCLPVCQVVHARHVAFPPPGMPGKVATVIATTARQPTPFDALRTRPSQPAHMVPVNLPDTAAHMSTRRGPGRVVSGFPARRRSASGSRPSRPDRNDAGVRGPLTPMRYEADRVAMAPELRVWYHCGRNALPRCQSCILLPGTGRCLRP